MTDIQLATTQELMNELGRRLKRVVVVGAFMNEVNQEQTFLFTGPTTDLNTSLGMNAWANEAMLVRVRQSLVNNTTGLYGGS